jgi:hypothetical protein
LESRWFSLDELESTTDPVEPVDLAVTVADVLRGGR